VYETNPEALLRRLEAMETGYRRWKLFAWISLVALALVLLGGTILAVTLYLRLQDERMRALEAPPAAPMQRDQALTAQPDALQDRNPAVQQLERAQQQPEGKAKPKDP
jgi:hypothetical protein